MNDLQNSATGQAPEVKTEVPTWDFEGKHYPMFVVNGRDSIGIPVKRNKDDLEPIGILGCNFAWGNSEPFRNRLDLGWKRVTNTKESLSEQHRKNLDRQNADCFDAICADGEWIAIKDGEQQPPVKLSAEKMRSRTTEIKSNAISEWVTSFHFERYFKGGFDEFEALTGGDAEQIYFKCSIGDVKDPNHILIIGFVPPSDDARREYDDKKTKNETKEESGQQIVYTEIDNARKLRYAKKYLHSVQGAVVESESVLMEVRNDETLKIFRDKFNPDWMFRLADALQDSFNIGGK